jgi:hypothetical protein
MATLPPQVQGSSGPFAQMWAVAESYLAGPFHYLRKGIYAFILLFGGMIWAKSSGSTQIAFALAGLESIILIVLFVRWQWLGLSALLGGVTAVLKQTATNDPDISEAILEGVKAFGKIIGWAVFVLAMITFGILMVPWESSTELTNVFFSFLAVVTGIVLFAWLAGFKTVWWRNVFVFWPMVIVAFALAVWGLVLMAQHYGIAATIWQGLVSVFGVTLPLWSWHTIVIIVGIVLLTLGVVRLIWWMTLKKRKGLAVAKAYPNFLSSALALVLVGTVLLLTPTIASWISTSATAWTEAKAKITALEAQNKALKQEKPTAETSAEEKKVETISTQDGGNIIVEKGTSITRYVTGTVTLINTVPCHYVAVGPAGVFDIQPVPGDVFKITITAFEEPEKARLVALTSTLDTGAENCGSSGDSETEEDLEDGEEDLHFHTEIYTK